MSNPTEQEIRRQQVDSVTDAERHAIIDSGYGELRNFVTFHFHTIVGHQIADEHFAVQRLIENFFDTLTGVAIGEFAPGSLVLAELDDTMLPPGLDPEVRQIVLTSCAEWGVNADQVGDILREMRKIAPKGRTLPDKLYNWLDGSIGPFVE